MSKKLEAKNSLIEVPVRSRTPSMPAENAPTMPRSRTAVGTMAQFVATQSPLLKEAEQLREQIRAFDGATPVRALSPASIHPSPWANRHEDSFSQPDFLELKREIVASGGNVQPIKVRPLNRSTAEKGADTSYEIVYGHRRHRACLESNLQVHALIEEIDDQTLFEQMERENRGRKNLSAWEQGCMYRSALDKGLYSSQRKLSESLGVDISMISKSIALANLPKIVIDAFASPLDVQFRWAQPLGETVQKDPDGILGRAKDIKSDPATKLATPAEVFNYLVAGGSPGTTVKRTIMSQSDKAIGQYTIGRNGAIALTLKPGALSEKKAAQFFELVETFIRSC